MIEYSYDHISPQTMLSAVENHIIKTRGRRIKITWPRNDRELQLLGRAYDIAQGKKLKPWDGGRSRLCDRVRGAACVCPTASGMCWRHGETDFLKKGEPVFDSKSSYAQWKEDQKHEGERKTYQKKSYERSKIYGEFKTFCAACHKEVDSCECQIDFNKYEFNFDFGKGPDIHGDMFSKSAMDDLLEQLKKKTRMNDAFWSGPTCKTCGLHQLLCNCR